MIEEIRQNIHKYPNTNDDEKKYEYFFNELVKLYKAGLLQKMVTFVDASAFPYHYYITE